MPRRGDCLGPLRGGQRGGPLLLPLQPLGVRQEQVVERVPRPRVAEVCRLPLPKPPDSS
jgi:hypothetical protein